MAEFDVFRIPRDHPFPSTMRTALRALRLGVEGPEPFYFRATSVDSIHKRPLDAGSIKELLARSRLTVRTNHELSRALFGGLVDEDRDLADFAAQALTRIENRYQGAIKERESLFQSSGSLEDLCGVGELLLDFAEIQWFDETLRGFYVERALNLLDERAPGLSESYPEAVARLRVRAEIMRGNLEEAEAILTVLETENDPVLLMLQAELAYRRRDIPQVREAMALLQDLDIDELTQELTRSWLPPREGE